MRYHFILPIILVLGISMYPKGTGDIIIIGGGDIPSEIKGMSGIYLVISTDIEYAKCVWPNYVKVKKYIAPSELSYDDLIGIDGIVICGGDQWQYLNEFKNGEIIQYAWENGINIIGTSAGAMILGEYYFSAEKGGITSEEASNDINVCLGSNFVTLEPLKGVIIDSHFSERNREGRLRKFIEKSGAKIGYGLDEGTGLYICADGYCKKIGVGSVKFLKN